jgi:hypothetical protein
MISVPPAIPQKAEASAFVIDRAGQGGPAPAQDVAASNIFVEQQKRKPPKIMKIFRGLAGACLELANPRLRDQSSSW